MYQDYPFNWRVFFAHEWAKFRKVRSELPAHWITTYEETSILKIDGIDQPLRKNQSKLRLIATLQYPFPSSLPPPPPPPTTRDAWWWSPLANGTKWNEN